MTAKGDDLFNPAYYTQGDVECIDAIRAMLGDGYASFLRGQIVKYVWRLGRKGPAWMDARKALWYAQKLAEHLEEQA